MVQRRDPLAQQRQFFARNRENAIHASDPNNLQNGFSKPRRSHPKEEARHSRVQPSPRLDSLHSNAQKGRKRNRNTPKISTDLLALAHHESNEIFKEALQRPGKKRRKSLNRPPLPPINGKVNRTLAVNAESNSVRVFEGDVEKSMIHRPPSDQTIVNSWQVDTFTPSRNPEKGTHLSAHQAYGIQYRRRPDPRISQKNAEDFSCFSKANALDDEKAMQRLYSQGRERRNSHKAYRISSPDIRKGENGLGSMSYAVSPRCQTGRLPSTQSPFWNAAVELEDEEQSRQQIPKHHSPSEDTPDPFWDTQIEIEREQDSRMPIPVHPSRSNVAPSPCWDGKDENGDELYSTTPSPERTKTRFHSTWKKQEPMNLDDFNAEIIAIEEKLLFSVDSSAGKFKTIHPRNSGVGRNGGTRKR